jgi:hypothetical protein
MSMLRHVSARSRLLLPIGAAAVVAVVVLAVIVVVSVVRSGNVTTQPPVLHLTSVAIGSAGLPAQSAAGISNKGGAPDRSPGGSGWRLEGTLPGGPSSGRVNILPAGAATRAFVSALARALGMSGEPQHLTGGWYLVSGTTELSVSELAGRHWTFSNHGCIAGPVLDPANGTACAVATSVPPLPVTSNAGAAPGSISVNPPPAAAPPVTVAPASPVPQNVARRLAGPVLQAVGVNPDAGRVDTEGDGRSVVFSPEVAGSTVVGLETRVSVDGHGQIVDASGWLATPTQGPAYPLISARQAYDQLLAQPQPMMGLAMAPCRIIPGTSGCAPTPDRVVTGATLGLTQAYSTDRGVLLVPAWLFQVRGETTPVAVVAVEPAFLGVPDQPSAGGGLTTGTEPGSIGGASGTNGSTMNPGPPTRVEPGGPATAQATKLAR